jgi:integrase
MSSGNRRSPQGIPLPPRIQASNGALYHVKRRDGKPVWTWLCRDGDEQELYKALAGIDERKRRVLPDYFPDYIKDEFPKLAPRTQSDYMDSLKVLGKDFADAPPSEVKPHHVSAFLRYHKTIRANRHRGVLSALFRYLMETGVVDTNPCHGVRRNPEPKRERYITDKELRTVMTLAPESVQNMIAVAYLTGLRQGDLRGLKLDDCSDDGVRVREGKTKRQRLYQWNPLLKHFIDRAVKRSVCDYLLTNANGQPWTLSGFQSAWKRVLAKWKGESMRFHDIRAKAASDHADGKGLLDHASEAVFRRHYDRKAHPTTPNDRQSALLIGDD